MGLHVINALLRIDLHLFRKTDVKTIVYTTKQYGEEGIILYKEYANYFLSYIRTQGRI